MSGSNVAAWTGVLSLSVMARSYITPAEAQLPFVCEHGSQQ